ncbi:MAG: hypothetical protein U5K27_06015 [Desulfotignum sp.]|nr:hypothetical protein [Desulfotignum sp.]
MLLCVDDDSGLYRIDEAKLNSLEDDRFLNSAKQAACPLLTLMIHGNIQVFEKMAKAQEKATVKNRDVVSFLGDDDVISFQ